MKENKLAPAETASKEAVFVLQKKRIRTGGTWQVSGGHLQPPRLFRRKASPTRGVKNLVQMNEVFYCIRIPPAVPVVLKSFSYA